MRLKTQDDKVKRLLYRHIMGRIFQTYTSMVTGLTVYDTQCGFKLLATSCARKIACDLQCNGFAFDVELLLLALRLGMHIREEPISWCEKGNTTVRTRHIIRMIIDIWQIKKRVLLQ